MLDHERVLIVGGGFSGTLLAINLLRHDGPHAILVERKAGHVARGIAYGTSRPEHVLNVRAGNMSAFPDDPDHFANWLARQGLAGGFVPRKLYGSYLADSLRESMARFPDRLEIVEGEVVALEQQGAKLVARLAAGNAIDAEVAVLAPGNLPPHDPPGLADGDGFYRADPWAPDALSGLGDGDDILLVGTGLTAVDVALTLDAKGFGGRILAMSRRGLAPRAHAEGQTPPARVPPPEPKGLPLLRQLRLRAAVVGWRTAVDELRPHTQTLWRRADVVEKGRFLRHLRPWWDVHRHRLAPVVAERIAAMAAEGRLRFAGGRIVSVSPVDSGAEVVWRPRHGDAVETWRVARIINCTGPQGDLLRSREPFLADLVARGAIRPDPLRLGIDVDRQGRVIGRDGKANEQILAVGPMTRGAYWEIVAVPDLRHQAWELARRLSSAHWVGGEGL